MNLTMRSKRLTFEEKGVVVLKGVLDHESALLIQQIITTEIKKYADELACSVADYLASVSRWAHPCTMTSQLYQWVESLLKALASEFIGESVKLHKINIISKSAQADLHVPCHQDIAYSREDPYEFSLWLALQDVGLFDGVLEFLPYSHREKIEPAVDFWFPEFMDNRQTSFLWQHSAIAVPVQMGDAIVFDSRIWHRSALNQSGRDRFALVTRWSRINYQSPTEIPERVPTSFGMWTCAQVTQSLLQRGLEKCFQHPVNADLATYLDLWQQLLIDPGKLPFDVDKLQAKKALKGVFILNHAAAQHNGGDAQGKVYAHLWHCLLHPLSQWLNQFSSSEG